MEQTACLLAMIYGAFFHGNASVAVGCSLGLGGLSIAGCAYAVRDVRRTWPTLRASVAPMASTAIFLTTLAFVSLSQAAARW